jgi:hypothetical protein
LNEPQAKLIIMMIFKQHFSSVNTKCVNNSIMELQRKMQKEKPEVHATEIEKDQKDFNLAKNLIKLKKTEFKNLT